MISVLSSSASARAGAHFLAGCTPGPLGAGRASVASIKKCTQAETQHAPLRQHANIIRPQPGTVTQPHSLTAHSSHAERRNHDDAARGLGGGSAAPVTPKAEGRAERLASKELTSSDK